MASDAMAAINLAIQLMQAEYNVSCALIIENETNNKMVNPVTNIHNGSLKVPPSVVKEHSTGVVGAHKTAYSVMGCGADIIWDLEERELCIQVDFGIAGGGWSWMNPNHLELSILNSNHGVKARQRNTFQSGKPLKSCVVSNCGITVEGTMGNTDCCDVKITVRDA